MKYVIALLLISCTANADSYYYIGLGAGKNTNLVDSAHDWEDGGEIGCSVRAGHRHHIGGSFYGDLNWTHNSQCLAGEPFGADQSETTSDHFIYFIEYRFGG